MRCWFTVSVVTRLTVFPFMGTFPEIVAVRAGNAVTIVDARSNPLNMGSLREYLKEVV